MGLRVEIQKRLITLFKNGIFPSVSYDSGGTPSTGSNLVPTITCNEVASSIETKAGSGGIGYAFSGWTFEVICEFTKEVDYSDFVIDELKDIVFNYNNNLITANVGSSIVVKHPPRQGSHSGTILQFNFNIKTRR